MKAFLGLTGQVSYVVCVWSNILTAYLGFEHPLHVQLAFAIVMLVLSCYNLWYIRSQPSCYLEWTLLQLMCIIMWSSTFRRRLNDENIMQPRPLGIAAYYCLLPMLLGYPCYDLGHLYHSSTDGRIIYHYASMHNHLSFSHETTIFTNE